MVVCKKEDNKFGKERGEGGGRGRRRGGGGGGEEWERGGGGCAATPYWLHASLSHYSRTSLQKCTFCCYLEFFSRKAQGERDEIVYS